MFSNFVQKASLYNYGYTSMGMPAHFAFDGTYNYIIDYQIGVAYIYDNYWQYQSYKATPYPNPYHYVYVSGYFYIVADAYVYKTDTNFNLIGTPYYGSYAYRGVAYINGLIYAAHPVLRVIQVFSTTSFNNYQYVLNTSPHSGNGLCYYNGKLYVGSNTGVVLVYSTVSSGSTFTSSFQTACTTYIMSISVDVSGSLGLSCLGGFGYAYTISGTLQNTLSNLGQVASIFLDSNGRLITVAYNAIYIYY
jgi:hypothetical protein